MKGGKQRYTKKQGRSQSRIQKKKEGIYKQKLELELKKKINGPDFYLFQIQNFIKLPESTKLLGTSLKNN